MKPLFLTLATSFILLTTSCKKDETPVPTTTPISGFWKGKYGLGNDVPDKFYFILIRDNGTARFYADAADTANVQGIESTNFIYANKIINSTYGDVTITATLNDALTHMDGTYGQAPQNTGEGTFSLDKQVQP